MRKEVLKELEWLAYFTVLIIDNEKVGLKITEKKS